MKISIGNDHAGTEYKAAIKAHLEAQGHKVSNHGTDDSSSVDYPDFIHPVATDVENGAADLGGSAFFSPFNLSFLTCTDGMVTDP